MMMRLAVMIVLLGALSAEYAPLRQSAFVYEDATWNSACDRPFALTDRLLSWRAFPRAGAFVSWCWQRRTNASVWQFHLVNLILHVTASALLGVLVYQLSGVEIWAWIAASLFLLHPLAIESAGYLAGRGELLAGVGVILACICALESEWTSAAFAIVIGLLGKETAIVAIALIPLVLLAKHRMRGTVCAAILGLESVAIIAATVGVHFSLPLNEWAQWALFQATAFVRLSILTIVPWGQTPTHDYARIGMGWKVLSLAAMVGLFADGWRWMKSTALLGIGALWMVVASVPRLLVPTPPSPFNEHQFYVPLMGAVLMGVHGVAQADWRWPIFVSEA